MHEANQCLENVHLHNILSPRQSVKKKIEERVDGKKSFTSFSK